MRKVAREAVIFCLLGTLVVWIALISLIFTEKRTQSRVQQPVSSDTLIQPKFTLPTGFSFTPPPGYVPMNPQTNSGSQNSDSDSIPVLILGSLVGGFEYGFPGGLVVWTLYRLIRFAIVG